MDNSKNGKLPFYKLTMGSIHCSLGDEKKNMRKGMSTATDILRKETMRTCVNVRNCESSESLPFYP